MDVVQFRQGSSSTDQGLERLFLFCVLVSEKLMTEATHVEMAGWSDGDVAWQANPHLGREYDLCRGK